MSLPLKVKITRINLTKTMNFAGNMSVSEACKHIREKIGEEGGQDHGLFQPAIIGRTAARWLKMDRTLQYFDLQPNDEVEYKKKHRPIKIKLPDETIKTVLVDDTLCVGDIVAVIGEKMSISNCDEFSLRIEGKDDWLNTTLSLQEQGVMEDSMLLFRKKYYVTDANVSIDDPVALHLVFVESRDNILKGLHPCTQEEALMFAALQCQIQLGNYDPQNPKKFEAKDFLPPQYAKTAKKLEEKIIKEYRKLVGMQEANAKYRYVQVCRSLKTYGITFYNVKQKVKGQKKPKDIFLGITRSNIMFMDGQTKELTKEIPLSHLKRWAAAPTTFTFDMGDHEDDYIVLVTNEGEAISALLAGYIDILLKKRNDVGSVKDEDDTQYAQEEPVAPIKAKAMTSTTSSIVGGFDPYGGQQTSLSSNQQGFSRTPGSGPQMATPTNLMTASTFIASMISDLSSKQPIGHNTALSPEQWKKQLIGNSEALMSSVAKLTATTQGGKFDRSILDGKAAEIAANLANLVSSAKNAALQKNGKDDPEMIEGAKKVSESIRDLLSAARDLTERPDDPRAMERFEKAQKALNAASAYLNAASKGALTDAPSQKLLLECAKNILQNIFELTGMAASKAQLMEGNARDAVMPANDKAKAAAEQLNQEVQSLAPSMLHTGVKKQVADSAKILELATKKLAATLGDDDPDIMLACKSVADAIGTLLDSTELAEKKEDSPDFSAVAKDILDEAARLMNNSGNPSQINQSTKQLVAASTKLVQSVKQAATMSDDDTRDRLLEGAKGVALATQKLVQTSGALAANPNDPNAKHALGDACQRLSDATKALVGNAAEKQALQNLKNAAKIAVAATTGLVTSSKSSVANCSDPNAADTLKANCKFANDSVNKLIRSLQHANQHPNDLDAQQALIKDSGEAALLAFKLVAAAKSAVPKINDAAAKNLLRGSADDAADALRKLIDANKAVVQSVGVADIDEALEKFAAEEANLDAAILDAEAGNLGEEPGQTPEGTIQLLNMGAKAVANAAKNMATSAKTNPDEMGPHGKAVAEAIQQVNAAAKSLASLSPRQVQGDILNAAKMLTRAGRAVLTSARSLASNPTDQGLSSGLTNATKGLADALQNLLQATKGSQTGGKELDEAIVAIQASVGHVKSIPSNPKEFSSHSEDVENYIKASMAAIGGLVNAVKNNPKLIGQNARTLQSTVAPLIQSANKASGACTDSDTSGGILLQTKGIVAAIGKLLSSAKNAALKDDPNLKKELGNSAKNATDSLESLLAALNAAAPGQALLDEALKSLADSAAKLARGNGKPRSRDPNVNLEEIKRATAQLGEATKGIITNGRGDPAKLGQASKNAANAIANLMDAAAGLAEAGGKQSAYQNDAQKVKDVAEQLVKACNSNDPNAKPQIVKNAKEITQVTQGLVDNIKSDAVRLDDEPQKGLMNAAQSIAFCTSQIVNAAKAAATNQPGSKDKLDQAHQNLVRSIDALLAEEGGKITTPKSKKLLLAAQEANQSTTQLIDSCKAILRHPDDQSELALNARNVGNAIKNLLDVAKSMGDLDLDQFIDKIAGTVADLDSAAISATVGLLENTAPQGATTQSLEEATVEVSRELATAIKDLVNSVRESPAAIAKAAANVAAVVPKLGEMAKQTAGTMSDQDKQLATLANVKIIADFALGLMTAVKANDGPGIANSAKNCSGAIAKLLGALKTGVIALRECDEASRNIAENSKKIDEAEAKHHGGPNSGKGGKSYAECQRAVNEIAKNLVGGIAKVVSTSKGNPQEVGEASKKVAALMDQFTARVIDAANATEDPNGKKILAAAKGVMGSTSRIIQTAKSVSSDPKNGKNLQKLSEAYQQVTDSIASMIAAIRNAATGEIKCEAAIDAVNRITADLDAAALYAATNQLTPERDDLDIEEVQNELLLSCEIIANELKNLVQATKGSHNELGEAAASAAEKYDKLSKDTKTVASLLNNLLNQQNLIAAAKSVGSSIASIVRGGIKSHSQGGNSDDDRQNLLELSKQSSLALKDLVLLAQSSSSLASSGVKELEVSRREISQILADFDGIPSNPNAGAHEVLKAAKGIADGVASILGNVNPSANSEDTAKLIKSAEDAQENAKNLVMAAKGAVRLTSRDNAQRIIQATKMALEATTVFMDSAKTQRKSATNENIRQTSEASDEVVKMIGELVEASKVLPGSEEALKLFQESDELEKLAESELLAAANSIEAAARTLMEAKQRQLEMRKNKESPLPEEQITEAILDAAKAITAATGTLVNAATIAQKELVAKGKVSQAQNVYRRDPAWARGLISAAQAVAGSVGDLVSAANSASQGNVEQELLVASAKGVAAATARLVFASRAKADPFSPAQQKLSTAAKSVANATQQLVLAAQSTQKEAEDEKPDWQSSQDTGAINARRLEMEQQMKILKLQRELENAQKTLGNIRKDQYSDASQPPVKVQFNSGGNAPGPQGPPMKKVAVARSPSDSNNNNNPPMKSSGNSFMMTKGSNLPPPIKSASGRSKPLKPFYTLDELKEKPRELDATRLEMYLADDNFVEIFGVDKDTFSRQPEWKRNNDKAKLGLM